MFVLSSDNIDAWIQENTPADNAAGACVTFEGRVRNHHEGKSVLSLEYEAFVPLAQSEGEKIIQEALERFNIIDVRAIHRHGYLNIGETAVWVGVIAAHRKDAFKACQYVIDEIKHRLPIWKKEHYTDGHSGWVNCHGCTQPTPNLYTRQIALPEIGEAGQQRLQQAKVLVAGAGGLGCPALQYLTAAGVGTIGICEFDTVSADNLHRQVLYDFKQTGDSKLTIALEKLSQQIPFVKFKAYPQAISSSNALDLFSQYDLVLDCTDNFQSKFLLNDAAVLSKTPLLHASLYQHEGQLYGYYPNQTACLRCLWPETPDESCIGNCAESGIIGAVAGTLGCMQAMEAIKFIVGMPNVLTSGQWITLNLLDYQLHKIDRSANPDCPACGENQSIFNLESDEAEALKISPEALSALKNYVLIDIRTEAERRLQSFTEAQPLKDYVSVNGTYAFEADKAYVLVCQQGKRSLTLAQKLQKLGRTRIYSLLGGLHAWKQPTPV